MRTPPAIGFEYRPSRALAVCIVACAALAVLAIALSGLTRLPTMVLIIVAIGYGTVSLWRFLHPRVLALTWRSDGSISVRFGGRSDAAGEVQGTLSDARVLGFLIVLHLRWPPGGRTSLWLLPDNLDADTRRRLRVRLGSEGAGATSVNADSI